MPVDVKDVSNICIAQYRSNEGPKGKTSFMKLLGDSLSFEYYSGVKLCDWRPHKDHDYRNLPFAVIVYVGDCDAAYYADIKDHGKIKVDRNCSLIIPGGVTFRLELLETGLLSNAHISFNIFEHIDILSLYETPFIIEGETAIQIGTLIDALVTCNLPNGKATDIYSLAAMKSYAYSLLCIVISKSKLLPESELYLINMQKLSAVLNFMTSHIQEKISRKELASIMHLSETRFHYVFTEIIGAPPMDYLMKIRMKKAQQLLIFTEKSITEIAAETGVSDVFHFSKQFKINNGLSPLKYRQSYSLLPNRFD